jgi:hypothetical protein
LAAYKAGGPTTAKDKECIAAMPTDLTAMPNSDREISVIHT